MTYASQDPRYACMRILEAINHGIQKLADLIGDMDSDYEEEVNERGRLLKEIYADASHGLRPCGSRVNIQNTQTMSVFHGKKYIYISVDGEAVFKTEFCPFCSQEAEFYSD